MFLRNRCDLKNIVWYVSPDTDTDRFIGYNGCMYQSCQQKIYEPLPTTPCLMGVKKTAEAGDRVWFSGYLGTVHERRNDWVRVVSHVSVWLPVSAVAVVEKWVPGALVNVDGAAWMVIADRGIRTAVISEYGEINDVLSHQLIPATKGRFKVLPKEVLV